MGGASVSGLSTVDLRPLAHSSSPFLALIAEQRVCRSDGRDSAPHLYTAL